MAGDKKRRYSLRGVALKLQGARITKGTIRHTDLGPQAETRVPEAQGPVLSQNTG